MFGVGDWSCPCCVDSKRQWGSPINRALGFGYLSCHCSRFQVCGTGQEGSQKLPLAQHDGGLWSCDFQGPSPGGGQAGLQPRAPRAGPPPPPPPRLHRECPVLSGLGSRGSPTRVPGSHSRPAPTHAATNGKLGPPSWGGCPGVQAAGQPRVLLQRPTPHQRTRGLGTPMAYPVPAELRAPRPPVPLTTDLAASPLAKRLTSSLPIPAGDRAAAEPGARKSPPSSGRQRWRVASPGAPFPSAGRPGKPACRRPSTTAFPAVSSRPWPVSQDLIALHQDGSLLASSLSEPGLLSVSWVCGLLQERNSLQMSSSPCDCSVSQCLRGSHCQLIPPWHL